MLYLRHILAKMRGYTAIAQTSGFKKRLNKISISGDNDNKWRTYTLSLWPVILVQALLFSTAFALGYLCTHKTGMIRPRMEELVQLGSVAQMFEYNRTYSSPPSNETNGAWIDLFPKRSGFIEHPVLVPNLSVVAVFHQLHCIVCRFTGVGVCAKTY